MLPQPKFSWAGRRLPVLRVLSSKRSMAFLRPRCRDFEVSRNRDTEQARNECHRDRYSKIKEKNVRRATVSPYRGPSSMDIVWPCYNVVSRPEAYRSHVSRTTFTPIFPMDPVDHMNLCRCGVWLYTETRFRNTAAILDVGRRRFGPRTIGKRNMPSVQLW